MSLRSEFGDWVSRRLQEQEPATYIDGGGTEDDISFTRNKRNREQLERYEKIYTKVGPIGALVDTRALMFFGVGIEYTSEDDEEVAEWLHDELPRTEQHAIHSAQECYWAGDSWPYVVENRAGEFSHIEFVDPKTVKPEYNAKGEITDAYQIVKSGKGRYAKRPLDTDRLFHITLRQVGRGPLGISLIEQNEDEIEQYINNQTQRSNAIKNHGTPKYHVKVGREGQSIPNKIVRMVRNQFSSRRVDEKTNWVTGRDIDVDMLDTTDFSMDTITDTDLQKLSTGFMVPKEALGLDGTSNLTDQSIRKDVFIRLGRAQQIEWEHQWLTGPIEYVIANYSPHSPDANVGLDFGEVMTDKARTASWLRDFTQAYTPDEIRQKLGDGPIPDDVDEEDLGLPGGEPETDPREQPDELSLRADSRDVFQTQEAAEERAQQLGCNGAHEHEIGGQTMYMPCESHERYRDVGATQVFRHLAEGELKTEEQYLWDIQEKVLWADETDKQLFDFADDRVPQFVLDRLDSVIPGVVEGVMSDISTMEAAEKAWLVSTLQDSMTEQHGWSLDSLQSNIREIAPGLEKYERERLARDLSQQVVTEARDENYAELEAERDEEIKVGWSGPSDRRTTDACEWIKDQIPEEGVSRDRLKELIQEAPEHDDEIETDPREFSPHISCRHSMVRRVPQRT